MSAIEPSSRSIFSAMLVKGSKLLFQVRSILCAVLGRIRSTSRGSCCRLSDYKHTQLADAMASYGWRSKANEANKRTSLYAGAGNDHVSIIVIHGL